jgi:porphobilinogen synthase
MLVYPFFVVPGVALKNPIEAMPGVFHFSVDELLKELQELIQHGINKVLLFGVGESKTVDASYSHSSHSIVPIAVKAIKEKFGDAIYIITDVCLCAYTISGHCGIVKDNYVQNDDSLEILAKMALSHAMAGADMVAPSDMMDGRIAAIRNILDENHFENTGILSYSVKYASAYYGPFREAADSSPQSGDRKTYQMDFRNPNESLKEAEIDEIEGADMLMVKPALAYLDIIHRVKKHTLLPLACYNVSGEYSMVKAAANAGMIDEQKIVMENMFAFARAGADIIITYHAKDIVMHKWME